MKYLSLLLVVITLITITSCKKDIDDKLIEWPSDRPITQTCDHKWNDATCTTPKTCAYCNETDGIALGHTTQSGLCLRCGENFSTWEIGEYEDEFGQPIGKKYMLIDSQGTFSNSATTNSDLYAALQIDKDNIGIMLWEYGRNLVKGTFDYEDYDITILDEKGTKHYFTGTIYKSGNRIYFEDADRSKVINILKKNDAIKIYIKSTKYSISSYLFTVSTKGFDSTYNSILH